MVCNELKLAVDLVSQFTKLIPVAVIFNTEAQNLTEPHVLAIALQSTARLYTREYKCEMIKVYHIIF